MKNKKKQYKPVPYRDGNILMKLHPENFVDQIGNKAIITYADYIDKKGNVILNYLLWVKWL